MAIELVEIFFSFFISWRSKTFVILDSPSFAITNATHPGSIRLQTEETFDLFVIETLNDRSDELFHEFETFE